MSIATKPFGNHSLNTIEDIQNALTRGELDPFFVHVAVDTTRSSFSTEPCIVVYQDIDSGEHGDTTADILYIELEDAADFFARMLAIDYDDAYRRKERTISNEHDDYTSTSSSYPDPATLAYTNTWFQHMHDNGSDMQSTTEDCIAHLLMMQKQRDYEEDLNWSLLKLIGINIFFSPTIPVAFDRIIRTHDAIGSYLVDQNLYRPGIERTEALEAAYDLLQIALFLLKPEWISVEL